MERETERGREREKEREKPLCWVRMSGMRRGNCGSVIRAAERAFQGNQSPKRLLMESMLKKAPPLIPTSTHAIFSFHLECQNLGWLREG